MVFVQFVVAFIVLLRRHRHRLLWQMPPLRHLPVLPAWVSQATILLMGRVSIRRARVSAPGVLRQRRKFGELNRDSPPKNDCAMEFPQSVKNKGDKRSCRFFTGKLMNDNVQCTIMRWSTLKSKIPPFPSKTAVVPLVSRFSPLAFLERSFS